MLESFDIYIILLFLIIIQSIVGVGILVIGTPALLILGINIIDTYLLLLPVSIITSSINLLILKLGPLKFNINNEKKTIEKFFFICLPSVFLGLILLREYESVINFKYLVSFIILFSLVLTNFLKNKFFKFQAYHLVIVGTVHGLTNSGGTLLSLFFSQDNDKNNIRYVISFFYLFLALFQYLIMYFIFEVKISYLLDYKLLLPLFIIGVFLGNFIVKYIDLRKFKLSINILAIITCIFLIVK